MHVLARARQIQRNLSADGLRATLYKSYYYGLGYVFDAFHERIDTTSPATQETLTEDGTPRGDRTAAFPCHPGVLRRALDALAVSANDVFLDIGCGKGRALVVARRYPFQRIIGVDLIPSHIRVCRRNLERLGSRNHQLILGDALKIDYPSDVTVCFLFKPFPEPVILACLARLLPRPRAVILMGSDALKHLPGYRLQETYRHGPSDRFDYLLFTREPGVES